MPKRARVGRKEKTRSNSTISYLKNNKRDSFYYCQGDDSFNELTFVEAARIFEAKVTEKAIPIHKDHYFHVSLSLSAFKQDLFVKSLGENVLIKLGPNDTRAIAFASAMLSFDFINDDEKKILNNARHAIRTGRFQKLPREINKFLKSVKDNSINRVDQFHGLMKILGSYPLLDSAQDEIESIKRKPIKESQLPEIIISESFT